LSLIWGSSFILIEKGLQVFPPVQVGCIRLVYAFLILLPHAIRNIGKIPGNKWFIIFLTGSVGNLIPAILFAVAVKHLESSLAGILNALVPLFTFLVAVFFFKFKINLLQIAGLILGFIGSLGLSLVNSEGGIGSMNIYVLLIVLATVCYAVSLNLIKEYLSGISSIVITSLAILSVGPLAIIYLIYDGFFSVVINTKGSLEALGYLSLLGIFGTAIGLILYTRLVLNTNAVFASSVTYLIPIVAIFWGIVDDEKIYTLHYAGMIMILIGIYLVNRSYTKLDSNADKADFSDVR
jgi:drug/metabolite transporter (DMT)-like permease